MNSNQAKYLLNCAGSFMKAGGAPGYAGFDNDLLRDKSNDSGFNNDLLRDKSNDSGKWGPKPGKKHKQIMEDFKRRAKLRKAGSALPGAPQAGGAVATGTKGTNTAGDLIQSTVGGLLGGAKLPAGGVGVGTPSTFPEGSERGGMIQESLKQLQGKIPGGLMPRAGTPPYNPNASASMSPAGGSGGPYGTPFGPPSKVPQIGPTASTGPAGGGRSPYGGPGGKVPKNPISA